MKEAFWSSMLAMFLGSIIGSLIGTVLVQGANVAANPAGCSCDPCTCVDCHCGE